MSWPMRSFTLAGKACALLLFLSASAAITSGYGQTLIPLRADSVWHEGNIALHDGTQLKGLIQYHEDAGTICYQPAANTDSKVFGEKKIFLLSYFDKQINKLRKFCSLQHREETSEKISLFEVLLESNDFAVITKRRAISAAQYEYIYLVGNDGAVDLFLVTESHEVRGFKKRYMKSTPKIVGENLVKKHTGSYWQDVKAYARDNKLKFNVKEDLIRSLQYYKLIAQI